jgi:hypothetical protein
MREVPTGRARRNMFGRRLLRDLRDRPVRELREERERKDRLERTLLREEDGAMELMTETARGGDMLRPGGR